MRRALLLLGVLVAAGCTDVPAAERALEATGIGGTVVIGNALLVLDVRFSVAPRDEAPRGTRDAPHPMDDARDARTTLQKDHWVARIHARETRPDSLTGTHTVTLEWNGEDKGDLTLAPTREDEVESATLAYDIGTALEPSSVYVLTVRRA